MTCDCVIIKVEINFGEVNFFVSCIIFIVYVYA